MSVEQPTRVVRDYLNDSRVWADFLAQGGFVEGDIVVTDPFKAGTTWTQNILQQILTNGQEPSHGNDLSSASPWLDSSWGDHAKMLATLKAQREAGNRRVIKSHLPADALPFDPKARYIFVGRNGKDLGLSFHSYLTHFKPETIAEINRVHAAFQPGSPPLSVPADKEAFLKLWVDTDGAGCCDLFGITKSWWARRQEPNVLVLHYADMVRDHAGTVAKIAAFIGGVDVASLDMAAIVEKSSFGYMKDNAHKMAPFGGGHMTTATAFFEKGPSRDFRSEISPELIAKFDAAALAHLGPECAQWLEAGVGK